MIGRAAFHSLSFPIFKVRRQVFIFGFSSIALRKVLNEFSNEHEDGGADHSDKLYP